MARYFEWKCNKCDFGFTAFGPQECLIDYKAGKLVISKLPHPGTSIASGLFLHGYCTSCKMEKDLVIVEFIEPCDPWSVRKDNIVGKYLENYSFFIRDHPDLEIIPTETYNFSAVRCPDCDDELIVYPFRNKPFSCPKCEMGAVDQIGEFWT